MTTDELLELAVQSHRQGRLMFAENQYRKILTAQPDHLGAMFYLGLLARQTARLDLALEQMTKLVQLAPGNPDYWNSLGVTLAEMNRIPQAAAAYQRAIAVQPNAVEALSNLADACCRMGDWQNTIAICRRVISLRPDLPEAHCNLGVAMFHCGALDQAIACYKAAISLRPQYLQALNNLGNALAIKLDWAGAIECYRGALAIMPDMAEIRSNLADSLARIGELDEAVVNYRRALEIRPDLAGTIHNLGNALLKRGEVEEAVLCHQRASTLAPGDATMAGDLILSLIHHPDTDTTLLRTKLNEWDEKYAKLLATAPPVTPERAGRRLRIGYVSADFRDHVVGRNLIPLFREHDRSQFEVFCYSNSNRSDRFTEQFQSHADHFISIADLNDQQAAELIRKDHIDVLVDLSLHSKGNRLLIFAQKPAPIQATFAGYPGSTGMSAVDWRLTDPLLDPPETDADYVERTLRLPHSFWCYDPAAFFSDGELPVAPLPALANGFITFGCLNNSTKINSSVLDLWSKVLQQLPQSRLVMLCPKGEARERAISRLAIDPGRIDFIDHQPRNDYLPGFSRFDIGLDTFPYNGHTSTLDALWMGVPVITRIGSSIVGRAGWSQLSNLNLTELAARNDEDFVRIAVELAQDQGRLLDLRTTLRRRMLESPLTDAKGFARNIEAAYGEMVRHHGV